MLSDINLLEKITKLNREKLVERSMFAKGAGAHGYFELTQDMSNFTKAKFLGGQVGK